MTSYTDRPASDFEVSITRSAGPDGAVVVFIDGEFGTENVPLRVVVNDEEHPVYAEVEHASDDTERPARTVRFNVTNDDIAYNDAAADRKYVPPRKDLHLGQYVRTNRHNYEGRVYQRHFTCPESGSWIAGQSIPLTQEQVDGWWVSILVHDGGAVVAPEDSVEVIDRFEFRHRDRDMYFPADDDAVQ